MRGRLVRTFFAATTTLRFRIVAFGAAVVLAVVGVFFQYWLPKVSETATNIEVAHAERQLGTLGDALVPYLLQNQIGGAYEILKQVQTQYPEWVALILRDENGQRLFPLSDLEQRTDPFHVNLSYDISYGSFSLGTLQIVLDVRHQVSALIDQVTHLGIMTLSVFGVTILCLAFGLDRLVLHRIATISEAAKKLAKGDYSARLPKGGRDELGQLVESFATMRETIRSKEKSLLHARDMAEHAADAKTRFLATMSHEIRTPLNGVLPVADILLESDLTPEQQEQVAIIKTAGRALKSVIDDILEITVIDAGELLIRKEVFSPSEIVRAVASMLSVEAARNGLTMEHELDPKVVGSYVGDGDRLRQVLINLVGNALKFTDEGSVKITAHFEALRGKNEVLRFGVTDTGIGIPEEEQARVFQRFAQVDSLRNRKFDGSGLGLAISSSLVQAMGGEMGLDSDVGHGSTFWFTLPLEPVVAPAHLDANDKADAAAWGNPLNQSVFDEPLNVLVVDDSKVNLKVAAAMVKNLGHLPQLASSGQEAVDIVERGGIDLVLMDQHMPGMDGLEATRMIRSLPGPESGVMISGLTASAFAEDVNNCIFAGMDDFLAKPLSRDDLARVVTTCLHKTRKKESHGIEARAAS